MEWGWVEDEDDDDDENDFGGAVEEARLLLRMRRGRVIEKFSEDRMIEEHRRIYQ